MSAETHLESAISQVSLFRRGAIVTREAALEGERWPEEVVLTGLPLSLRDTSARARLVAAEDEAELAQPIDVRIELELPPAEDEPAALDDEEAELRQCLRKIEALELALARIDEAAAGLDRVTLTLPEPTDDSLPPPISTAAWTATSSWLESAHRGWAERRDELRGDLRDEQERRQRLERALEQQGRTLDTSRLKKRAVVTLAPRADADRATLELEYEVPGASWRPTYVVRIARDGQDARLEVGALVTQRTGEDWERVRLAASTADLEREIELPELKSLRIGRRQRAPRRPAWRPPPEGLEELFASLDQAQQSRPPTAASPEEPLWKKRRDAEALAREVEHAPRRQPREEESPKLADWEPEPEMEEDELVPSDLVSFGGAPAPGSPTAPPPPPMAKMKEVANRQPARARASAELAEDGPAAPPAEAPVELEPGRELLDYRSLRLAGGDAPPEVRGRLQPMDLSDALGADRPSRQLETIRRRLDEARREAEQLDAFPEATISLERSSAAFDYRYAAQGRVEIPSDGQLHTVPLFRRTGEATITLVVVPRESDQAVRLATLDNPLGAPVLAGPAEVYLDGEYLTTTQLETTPPEGRLSVGLGVEEALKVARRTSFEEISKGLLGGHLELKHKVEVEVASRLSAAVTVEVRERLPVLDEDEKEIGLELAEVEPPWQRWKQDPDHPLRGGRRWRFELAPGAQKALRYGYTILIDAKQELVGGNRREQEA